MLSSFVIESVDSVLSSWDALPLAALGFVFVGERDSFRLSADVLAIWRHLLKTQTPPYFKMAHSFKMVPSFNMVPAKNMKRPSINLRTPAILIPILGLLTALIWKHIDDRYSLNMPTSPILSVIIPCYNCERWLNETLQSVQSQTFTDFSIIFIDDGSRKPIKYDKLKQMYDGDIRLLRHWKNMGLSAARNTGVMAAKSSRYIVFLDPDDIIEPTALEKMLLKMALEPNTRCAFIYPAVTNFRVDETTGQVHVIGVDKSPYSSDALWRSNFITSFALIDRDIFMAAGGMCERIIKWWEDYDFWLRLANLGYHGELLGEPVFWYRRHSVGRSSYISRNIEERKWRLELMVNNPKNLPDFDDELAEYDEDLTPPCYFSLDDSKLNLVGRLNKWVSRLSKRIEPKRVSAFKSLRGLKPIDSLIPLLKKPRGSGKPSVLFVIPWCQIGGADSYDLDLTAAIKDRFDIVVVTEIPVDKHQNLDAFKAFTKDIFHLPTLIDETDLNAHSLQNRLIQYLIETRNVKHVYCRNSFTGYRFFKYGTETGLKKEHGLTFYDIQHVYITADEGGWEHTTIPYHRFIDHRIVISQDLLRRQLELLGEEARYKFKVIPPSIDLQFWGDTKECTNPLGTTVMFIGRVDNQKDPLKWVQVASVIAQMFSHVRFLVVGDGPFLDQMKADSAHLGDRIQFTSKFLNSSQIKAVLQEGSLSSGKSCNRSVLLMTSKYEGLPITIMEAVASGVQVVTTPVGAVAEIAKSSSGLIHLSYSNEVADVILALSKLVLSPLNTSPDACSKSFGDSYSRQAFNSGISELFVR